MCALSGKLPTGLCPDRIFEWFVRGEEPAGQDDFYREYWVLKSNGRLLRPECAESYPAASREQKTLITYPAAFQRWAGSKGLSLPAFEPCALSKTGEDAYPDAYSTQEKWLVVLDSPDNRDEFMIVGHLPLDSQKIPFRVLASPDVEKITFVIDGKDVATVEAQPFSHSWIPQKGEHTLKAVAELYTGEIIDSAPVSFTVH